MGYGAVTEGPPGCPVGPRTYSPSSWRSGPYTDPPAMSPAPGSSLSLCVCGTSFQGELGQVWEHRPHPCHSGPSVDPPGIGGPPAPQRRQAEPQRPGAGPGSDSRCPWGTGPRAAVPTSPSPSAWKLGRVKERTRMSAGLSKSDIPEQRILTDYSFTENQQLINIESEFVTNTPIISRKAGISAA